MTGADIEAAKEALSEAGYTYTEKDGTVTIEKKPASSSGSEGKGEYTVKYEDLVLFTVNEEILKEMPDNAGTKNGTVITMSSAWINEGLSSESKKHGKEYVAVIFYGNDEPGFLEQEDLQSIESLLDKDTDYKISSDKKVIVITESGLVKYFGASTVFVDTDIPATPLFDVSELTVAAERIAWTEGTWLLKIITDYSDGSKAVDEDKIKADSSGIKYTEMIFTQTGTVTESMSKAQFDMLTAAGKIKGNQYTYTVKTSEDDIAEENERIVRSFNHSISDLKTNADKTKYYWKTTGTSSREGVKLNTIKKYYLEKKSGTSTPVILPESSKDDNHGSSQSGTSVPSGTTVPSSFNGKYSGKVSGNGSKGFVEYSISVEISDGHYSVKLVEDSEEAVEPYFTASGNLSLYTGSSSTNLTGAGSDHLFSATLYEDSEDNEWDVTVQLTSGFAYKGTMKDVNSGKGNDSSVVKPSEQGKDNEQDKDGKKDSEFVGIFYTIKCDIENFSEEDDVPVPEAWIEDVLKGVSSSDYEIDDEKYEIIIKTEEAALKVYTNYNAKMAEEMNAYGYEQMDD